MSVPAIGAASPGVRMPKRPALLLTPVVVLGGAAGGAALGAGADWQVAFGVLALVVLLAVGLVRPAAFLGVLLLVRPLLDATEAKKLELDGFPELNLAGAIALVCIGIVAVVVSASRHVIRPAGTRTFVLVLLVSVVAAGLALQSYYAVMGTTPIAELVRLVTLLSVYVLAANVCRTAGRVRGVFVMVALGAVLPAAVGIYQLIHGTPVAEGLTISRIYGTFTGPNPFGAFLAVAGLTLVAAPRTLLPVWMRLVCLLAVLVALVGSFSREGWSMFAIGIVLLFWRRQKRVLLLMAALALVVAAAVPSVRDRVLSQDAAAAQTSTGPLPASYAWRIETWRLLMEKWREKPILGHGLRTTPFINPRAGFDAHNSAVKLLVEGGVVLLAVYVAFFASVVRRLFRLRHQAGELEPYRRLVFVFWILMIVVGLTTDDPLAATAMLYAVFISTGAVQGAIQAVSGARVDAPALRA